MKFGKHSSLIAALLILSLLSPKASAEWSCDILLHAVSDKELAESWVGFGNTERDVLAGKKSPAWEDFDRLDKLVSYLKRYKTNLESTSKLTQFDADLKSVEKTLMDELKFDPDLSPVDIDASTYIPGDYELRTVYRYYLDELNQMFPGPLLKLNKIPVPKFSKSELASQAETMLSTRSEAIRKTLFELKPEFKNWDDLQKWNQAQIDASPADSALRKVAKLFENPSAMSYRMRRPVNGRFWVTKSGFQNQFVTASSKGTLDPEIRLEAEIKLLGTDKSYSTKEIGLRAKYGYMQFPESSELQIEDGATYYGEDIYVFKYENVKNRATFTVGDSLGYAYYSGQYPKSFGQLFSPLSKLSYAETFFAQRGMSEFLNLASPSGLNNIELDSRYLEVQFFAPMDLDDVEEFIFTTKPPEGDFLKELLSRKVKIKDGRKNFYHPVDWVPPETDSEYIPILQRAKDQLDGVLKKTPVLGDTIAAAFKLNPVTPEEILKLFPKVPATDLKLVNGTGRIDIQKDTNFSYYIQTMLQPDGTSEAVLIPMSTSRLAPGWVSTPEWWKLHADEIAKAKASGLPQPRQDPKEVAEWLRQNGYSTNPLVYKMKGTEVTSVHLQDYLLDFLSKNAKVEDDSYVFYRGAGSADELATWENHMRPKGSRYWTPTATYAWRYGRKQAGFLRSLLKGEAPVIRFKIPKSQFQQLVQSGDLTLGTELTVKVHDQFNATGLFKDQLTDSDVYVGSGGFTPEIEIRATRKGADGFLQTFSGAVGIEEMSADRILLLQKSITRVKSQYPESISAGMVQNLESRIARVQAEEKLLIAIRDKHPKDEVQGLLKALPMTMAEMTNTDGESIEMIVSDYVAGKL